MTKEELRAYRTLAAERDHLLDEIAMVDARLYGPRVLTLTGMPSGSHAEEGDAMAALTDKAAAIRARYAVLIEELADRLLAIEDAIGGLEPVKRRLLRLRYIDGLTWERVAVEMDYSWTQVHRLHGEALAELREA